MTLSSRRILFILSYVLTAATLLLSGCRDDLLYDPEIGEGDARVSFSMGFEPVSRSLGLTRADGNAVNKINSVTLIAYNRDGSLYRAWRSKNGDFKYTQSTNTSMPGDETLTPCNPPVNGTDQAEKSTPKVDFSLPETLPFGRYYMYAVANLDLTDEQIATQTALKENSVKWQTNVADNDAMFGYFCNTEGVRSQGFDAELVTIDRNDITVWSWIRRCVSKVTVAFDGRRLNPNVTIYLKSVQIKDIPSTCYIGKKNEPNAMSQLITDGESIEYAKGTGYDASWPATVTKGNPVYGALGRHTTKPNPAGTGDVNMTLDEQIIYQHSESAPALYFFENMQGEGKAGTVTDKRQDVNGENKSVSYPNGNNGVLTDGFKDGKEFGTYIEVRAYYSNTGSGDQGQGDIIYRFMLGQDDHLDYNAIRNHHYKLTMSFNGNANDVDWHIVYEQPKVVIPRPYYISYLYNHKMMLPITINAGESEIEEVQMKIISNAWAPKNPGDLIYWSAANQPETYPWNGFLSLHETTATVVKSNAPFSPDSNKPYYEEAPKRGERTYKSFNDGANKSDGALASDLYYVKKATDKDGMNIYELSIPMYTRSKQLVKQTAYTGNNPYSSYEREAKVSITVKLKNGTVINDIEPIEIIQLRRIINPKGVYRSWRSTKTFHVNLKALDGENAHSFSSITSQGGPWKAYVVKASSENSSAGTEDAHGMLSFSGQDKIFKSNNKNISDTIYGDNGSQIDFNLLFNNSCSNSNVSRHAIVRVEYNNNTCYHLIFVRQGNAPVKLTSNGRKWHNTNMISKTEEAASPVDEGSLFKQGNWDWPIASSSNVNNGKTYWTDIEPDDFKKNGGGSLTIVGKTDKYGWTADGFAKANSGVFSDPSTTVEVATFDDYANLYQDENIEQGYGVLYGNDAAGTLTDLNDAYGVSRFTDKSGGESMAYGMRGTFVYNKETGVSVFFPIGNSGYGHRKNNGTSWPAGTRGLLRYSCNGRWGYFPSTALGTAYPNGVNDCPLFYDIFMRPGAIYWLKQEVSSTGDVFKVNGVQDTDVTTCAAWDFNFYTFDFYGLSNTNLASGADACFVRCVSK